MQQDEGGGAGGAVQVIAQGEYIAIAAIFLNDFIKADGTIIWSAVNTALDAGKPMARFLDEYATLKHKALIIGGHSSVWNVEEDYDRVVDIFPTSTGEPGHETFNVRARAFRFDPALENDGWHDSSSFPVEIDNPLNGNMYKPIYFNEGQAIHGAEYIPLEAEVERISRVTIDEIRTCCARFPLVPTVKVVVMPEEGADDADGDE